MVALTLVIWAVVRQSGSEHPADLTFSELMDSVNKDTVREVTISGTDVTGTKKDNSKFKSTIPANYPDLYKILQDKNVKTTIKDNSSSGWMTWVANGVLPIVLLIGLWIFFLR